MLAAPKNFVKGTPETPSRGPSLGLSGILLRAVLAIVGGMAAFNILVAYRDAADHRNRAAALERELDSTRSRNERIQVRIQGLSGNPALLERWLREGEQTLPDEEVLK
jgi:hypothetical protein